MMKNLKVYIILLLLISSMGLAKTEKTATQATRSFMAATAEPYFGYLSGTYKIDAGLDLQNKYYFSGYGVGMRLGIIYKFISLSLDGTKTYLTFPHNSSNSISNDKAEGTLLGLVAGLPIRRLHLRIWGGINFIDKQKEKISNDLTLIGYSYKLGIGYLLSFFSLNFEYMKHFYTKFKTEGVTQKYPYTFFRNTYDKPRMETFFLTISLPFSIQFR